MFVGAHWVCGSDEWAWLCALPGHEGQCERPEGRRRDPFCDVTTEYLRHLVRKAASTAGCAADTTTAFCVVCTLEVPSGARTCPHCFSVPEAFADTAGIVSKCAVKWAAVTTCPCALLLLCARATLRYVKCLFGVHIQMTAPRWKWRRATWPRQPCKSWPGSACVLRVATWPGRKITARNRWTLR